MTLDPVEGRVVGSLVEKQLSTPQQYPLSLNSLTLACNQTSNRDPVVSYAEADVQAALDSLKAKGLVRFVLPSHGRSVVRYRHVLDEKLALDARQMALVAVLLLRGPQTVGELRTRTERMAEFDSLAEVESDLEGLTRWAEPLVARLARRPGQKEERWMQLLADGGESPPAPASPEPAAPPVSHPSPYAGAGAAPAGRDTAPDGVGALRRELARVQDEVAALRADFEALRRRLGDSDSGS
ncbi:MAG TPA: YceH family protein [Acidimicrobiales bacterium]|nr:YceH family protein [Acidimicrobiales bacterium]